MATPAQELVAARIAVATATPTQYQRQRWRLAGKVRTGTIDRVTAVDTRYEIAIAHALVRAPGEVGLRRSLLRHFAGVGISALYASEAAVSASQLDGLHATMAERTARATRIQSADESCGEYRVMI